MDYLYDDDDDDDDADDDDDDHHHHHHPEFVDSPPSFVSSLWGIIFAPQIGQIMAISGTQQLELPEAFKTI